MLREMCNAAKWTAVSAGAFLLAQPFAYAQQMPPLPAPVLQQTTTPTLQQNPQIAMREFEPAENQEYELGRGDAISIDFAGRPEMSSKQIVGPDGRITLPMAGALVVADKTREQAAQAIVAALTPFYEHLNVTVGVDKYTSNQVLLLGAVEHPGVLTFDRPPTLLEVVSRGGAIGGVRNAGYNTNGFTMQANLQPMGSGVPERCAIYRGADKVIWVDLKKLLDSGSALADLRLKRDDIVIILIDLSFVDGARGRNDAVGRREIARWHLVRIIRNLKIADRIACDHFQSLHIVDHIRRIAELLVLFGMIVNGIRRSDRIFDAEIGR